MMAEHEAQHRHTLEGHALRADIADREQRHTEYRTGQWLAFSIGVIALSLGTYTAIHGAQIAGAFIGTSGVVGLVSAFLYKRSSP